MPGVRKRTRAFIKAQDGCDNQCTFCITTIARGQARSMPQDQILSEIQSAVAGGTQEAVLTGVQLTAYGKDLSGKLDLKSLVESILIYTDIPRLRLSSLEPWEINEDFFSLWENPRLCRQIHLPLQSGSNKTLRRMGRPIDKQRYASLISKARRQIPYIAITTDIMVGFPGETEVEFKESLDFIKEMSFAHAHVFTYSLRPGTPAAHLPDKVHHNIARQRSQQVREIIDYSSNEYKTSFIGKDLVALWETTTPLEGNRWKMRGITDNYLRVYSLVKQNVWNQLTPVHITEWEDNELRADVLTDMDG